MNDDADTNHHAYERRKGTMSEQKAVPESKFDELVKSPEFVRSYIDSSNAELVQFTEHIAALTAENARMNAQLAEADFNFGGWRAIKSRLEAENERLRSQVEALSKPITDEEWQQNYGHGGDGKPELADRIDFDRIIRMRLTPAAREKPEDK